MKKTIELYQEWEKTNREIGFGEYCQLEVIKEIFDSIERISRFCSDDSIFRGELNRYMNKLNSSLLGTKDKKE